MEDPLVRVHEVSKVFGDHRVALDRIDASVPRGKLLGIVGPDGAGKTTLIRLIAGLFAPTSGSISINGYDTIKDARLIRPVVGYMPQQFGLYEELTVRQNLNLHADLRGVVGKERIALFERLLAFTGLSEFTHRLARSLSGGMKQKLGLACALLGHPQLLLLDEPSVGVDPLSRRELWKMTEKLLADGITIVWSTAYLDESERCDLVLLLNEGRLLFHGPPCELTKRAEGRVFLIPTVEGNRRQVLATLMEQPSVLDAMVQGAGLRVVMKEGVTPDPSAVPTSPRFEDAFIDVLGGGPRERSALAAAMPQISNGDGEHVIHTKDLTKCFGAFTAAHGISLDVKRGEIFGLLGPNGAGKSTTFKMLCGLLKPTNGSAFVEGVDLLTAPSEARSHIGYMAQKFSLYGDLSVRQNLTFFAGAYNLSFGARRRRIAEVVEMFDFRRYLDTSARDLPLGFKQRLALSCAVMHWPKVLFLDEPTSGVDPITRREFWNHINGLVEKGVTIMVTTHFMDEADYCDRIALVYRGTLITIDTPDRLKTRTKSATLEEAFIRFIEEYDEAT